MKTIKDGITLGKAKVIVDIVAKGNVEIRPATEMNPTEICVHNTGNSGRGADAKSHNKYLHNMAKLKPKDTGYASWHFTVDDKYIIQELPIDECAWHTGDGSGAKSGNKNAIGIEICENSDMTPAEYKQAEENAIALIVHLMKLEGIKASKVKPHESYSGKHCPRVILNRDGSFKKFHGRVEDAVAKSNKAPAKVVAKKAVVTELSSDIFGTLKVLADNLNIREKADFSSKIVDVAKKGETFKVYAQKNGLYHLGGKKYTTSNIEFVKFTKNANHGTKPRLVEILAPSLYTYTKADWDAKGEIVKKGEVFTIASELTVDGSKMYKLKSGVFITASTKYVKIK